MMQHINKIFIFCLLVVLHVSSHAFNKEDETIVLERVDQIKSAVNNADANLLLDVLPPKLFSLIAGKAEISEDEAYSYMEIMISNSMSAMKEQVSSIDFNVDVSRKKIFKTALDKEYMVLPTLLRFTLDSENYRTQGNIVAIKENDMWYLMRIESDKQVKMLREMYPDIKSIELFKKKVDIE